MNFKVPIEYNNIYSTESQAIQINNIIKKYIDKDSKITDATSCIGGNSKFFCRDFKYVNCIEKNKDLIGILDKNLSEFNNKIIYNCSYNLLKYTLKQDLIFIDPPWGSFYKSKNSVNLYLDDMNVFKIIDELYNYTRYIVIKVPNNINKSSISNNFWNYKIYTIKKNNKSIFKL